MLSKIEQFLNKVNNHTFYRLKRKDIVIDGCHTNFDLNHQLHTFQSPRMITSRDLGKDIIMVLKSINYHSIFRADNTNQDFVQLDLHQWFGN